MNLKAAWKGLEKFSPIAFIGKWGLLLIALAGAIGLGRVYWKGIGIPAYSDPEKLGQLGDYFGGLLNPLVSTLTLFVAVKVWRSQEQELATQRGQQRFFDLMNVYYQTVNSVTSQYLRTIHRMKPEVLEKLLNHQSPPLLYHEEIGSELVPLSGKSALAHLCVNLENREVGKGEEKSEWTQLFMTTLSEVPSDLDSKATVLRAEWQKAKTDLPLGHYFRTVTLLFQEAERLLGKEEHWRYVEMFITQLSNEELTLLAYYMWLDENGLDFLDVAKKYGVLRHMQVHRKEFESYLPKQVFTAPT